MKAIAVLLLAFIIFPVSQEITKPKEFTQNPCAQSFVSYCIGVEYFCQDGSIRKTRTRCDKERRVNIWPITEKK